MSKISLLLPVLLISLTSAMADRIGAGSFSRDGADGGSIDAQGAHVGRFGAGSVSATGPNGSTYDSSSVHAGAYGSRDVDAQGANGGSYSSSTQHYGGYSQGTVNANGANGGAYNASWSGYRSGYVYHGGVYQPAHIVVNTVYVAPVGAYAGWNVISRPYYISYPQYATYPVEVAVQVELKRQGYYGGTVDGQIGPKTQQAIAKYQSMNGLAVTGSITQALLKSLHID